MLMWTVPSETDGVAVAIATLIDAVGTTAFGARMLGTVNSGIGIGAGSMCAYRLSGKAPPTKYCASSIEPIDPTGSCFHSYRAGIYLRDQTFEAASDIDIGPSCLIGHLTADDVKYRPHRERIYRQHALLDRLTVAGREPNGDLLAVNFYRHCSQGHYPDRALGRFEAIAHPVLAAVRRHRQLIQTRPDFGAGTDRAGSVARYERLLASHEPGLTARERAVCARLLTGMLYEGIATDLSIALPTVKTYRNRAFERLGIHFRTELFNIAIGLGRPD